MTKRSARSVLLPLAILACGCRGGTSEKPPIHLNPNMDQQRRLDPQQAFPFFPDGRASRPPVDGTVAWGSLSGGEHYRDGRSEGAFAATLPQGVTLSRQFLERGRERYEIYCTPCHDPAGTGKGSVVARGMLAPPTFHQDRLRAMPIGQLYDVIKSGVRNMPSYGAQVPPDDRWAIAAYVRALQVSQDAPLELVPSDVRDANAWAPPPPAPEPEPAPQDSSQGRRRRSR